MHWLKQQLVNVPALLVSGMAALLLLLGMRADAIDQDTVTQKVSADFLHLAAETQNPTITPVSAGSAIANETNVDPSPARTDVPVNSEQQKLPAIAPSDHAGMLTTPRLFALGMIETGNNDSAIGGLGEVSRFQIMPSVWKHYNSSRSYRNLNVATEVARQHWRSLYDYFKEKSDREPTDFDMYVLWNTRYGYYASKGFEPVRLSPVVRDRAQRFTNLVEDGLRRESPLAMADAR